MARPRPSANPASARAVAFAIAAALAAGTARAEAQERTWHLGGSLGFSTLFGGPTAAGFGGGVHAAYGINDLFNLVAVFDVSAHPYARWVIPSGGVGATYLLDVGPWIPYAGAIAGPAGILSVNPTCGLSIAEPCSALRINLEIPFGIDWRATKSFTVGAGGRFQLLLLGDVPWFTVNVTAKAEYTWERKK